jgi:23S rRNA (uridine2552-2'-O)-methyltransferase
VPDEWLRKHKKDQYHRLAKDRGYRSRAAFKLKQMNEKYAFIERGDFVLDLGAAPGGWLQVAHQIVGNRGYILGVDKQPIDKLPFENVETAIADITDADALQAIESVCGSRKFEVVISDLAQNVSGVWEVDHARQIDLARGALRLALQLLRRSGCLLVKVFQGSELNDFRNEMKTHFHEFRIIKPPASRSESAELYFLGLDFTG